MFNWFKSKPRELSVFDEYAIRKTAYEKIMYPARIEYNAVRSKSVKRFNACEISEYELSCIFMRAEINLIEARDLADREFRDALPIAAAKLP